MPIRRTLATFLLLTAPLVAQTGSDRVVERYKQMLEGNPVEGTVLDRLWKLYQDGGKTNDLIAEYQKPGTLASEMVLGHLLRKAGDMVKAREAYEKAAKLDPQSPLPWVALGRLAADEGKAKEAATLLEKGTGLIPANDPRLAEALLQLGAQWLAAGDLAKAAEAWERIVALKPDDLELRRRLADNYARNHLPDRAIKHLEYIQQHSPPAERAQALQQIARVQQGAGNQTAAIEALEKALALTTPGNWLRIELQSQLIRLHQRYHRTAELEERWKKHALENPRDLSGYLQLIDLYERLGELEKERSWLEKLTELAPKNPDYRLRLARLLVRMEQVEAASAAYDTLLKEQPANPELVFERARLDVQSDATGKARERIAKLLELRPKDETVRGKALEFYEQNLLTDLAEQHLLADASANSEEAILALANFYFGLRREDDAKKTLQRLIDPKASEEKQAGAYFKIAQTLKGQNSFPAASAALEQAIKLRLESREFYMLLGELETAQGHYVPAQKAYERAVELSPEMGQLAEADQRLFESFRGQPPLPNQPRTRTVLTIPLPGSMDPAASVSTPELDQYLARMEQEAAAKPSEQAWLRLARWRGWRRENRAAQEAIGKALAINDKSVAAYELLVRLSTTEGPTTTGVFHLMKLIEIDPANRLGYLRRAGQIELQAGRLSEALQIFTQIAQEMPGNVEALTDLALTQQRADRWTEALQTWRQIYAVSPVSKKREAFGPLLRVLERLDMHAQSAELQLKAVETEADEKEQFRIFNDLLAHCGKYQLLDWLRDKFIERRKLRADEYFTEVALGRIFKAQGKKAAAFEVLADASYAAPNQAEALPELVREAEDLRKLENAVKLQEQYLRIVPQTRPDGFIKLAQLQEKNFDLEEAAKTWERLVAKFPRDTAVLSQCVEFQIRWGTTQRAAELLRKMRQLEPKNLKSLAHLAELDVELGEIAEAEGCLEQILKDSPAEAPGDPIFYPALKAEDAGRLQTAYLTTVRQRKGKASSDAMRALKSFWAEEANEAKGEKELRLNAIRHLAQIVRDKEDPAVLKSWVERWKASPGAGEALWALYYAGAGEPLLDRMEHLMQTAPRDVKMPQAYIWLAMQTGQFSRLSTWLQDRRRTASERDYLLIALGQYLNVNEGQVEPELIQQLFPQHFSLRLWQIATLFSTRNRYREASILAQRVFDDLSVQRASYGRELARIYTLLGEANRAREVLRLAIATPGETFEADTYGALREYYFLLPEAERAEFVEQHLASIDEHKDPLHRAISGAILYGLSGNEAAAQKELDALLRLHPVTKVPTEEPASSRRWRLLVVAGVQLQTWHLEKLAIYLWEKALDDSALIQLQGEQAQETAREMRQRLYALRTAQASPLDAQRWIDAFARISARDGLIPLGETLEAMGASTRAIEVFRQLSEKEPTNPQYLRNLLSACRTGNDNESAEAALWQSVTNQAYRANDGAFRDLVLQLADLLERKGELEKARFALSESVENAPGDTRLLFRLGQLHERAQRPDLAEAVYRRLLTIEPSNGSARIALAALLEKQGRGEAALALLQKGGGPDVDARLAMQQLKIGQTEDALGTLERIPAPLHISPALNAATLLAEKGEQKLARSVIQAALARTTDSVTSFPLLCKAVELLTPAHGPATIRREIRRLRQVAAGQPNLLGNYLEFTQAQSVRLGFEKEFNAELQALWSGGSGPIPAASVILTTAIKAGDTKTTSEVLEQLLAREDASEMWLYRIAGAFESAGQRDGLVRVRAQMAKLNPANDQTNLDYAKALHQAGKTAEARGILERMILRAAINEDIVAKVAEVYAEFGDRGRARRLFELAIRNDPYGRNFQAPFGLAKLQIEVKDFEGARRTLKTAYASPGGRDFGVFLDWLKAAGKMEQATEEIAALDLPPARQTLLRRALFVRYAEQNQLAPALALAETHPEMMTVSMAGQLRALAKNGQDFAGTVALLERLISQTENHSDLSLELAQVLGDWAEKDIATGNTPQGITRLQRAHELQPGLYEVARRLAAAQHETGAAQAAIETLESYLAAAVNPVEVDKAQAMLNRLKTGGKL